MENVKDTIKQVLALCKDKNTNIDEDFLNHLYEIVEDKDQFRRAVWLFANGLLPYDVATGDKPINVRQIMSEVRRKRREQREKAKKDLETRARLAQYLDSDEVRTLRLKRPQGNEVLVFLDDGKIVAFASKRGGNVQMLGAKCLDIEFNWNPHEHLGYIRGIKKAFYREVKKAAYNEPKELFNFNNPCAPKSTI